VLSYSRILIQSMGFPVVVHEAVDRLAGIRHGVVDRYPRRTVPLPQGSEAALLVGQVGIKHHGNGLVYLIAGLQDGLVEEVKPDVEDWPGMLPENAVGQHQVEAFVCQEVLGHIVRSIRKHVQFDGIAEDEPCIRIQKPPDLLGQ
jgi:hypothetical protein